MPAISRATTNRPAALEGFLFGPEVITTPGVAVAASQRFRSMDARFKQGGNVESYMSSGSRFVNRYVLGEEWAESAYSGFGSFTEDHFIMSSLWGAPTVSTVGTAGKSRVWLIDPYASYDPQTYTFAAGQAVRGELYPAGFFNSLKYTVNRQRFQKSGNIMAQAIQDNTAIAGSPTFIALQPMLPGKTYFKFASTYAGLAGATKYRGAFEIGFEYSAPYSTLFPVVDDNPSYDGLVEIAPTATWTLQTNKLSTAMGYLLNLRASDVIYFEMGCVGPNYEAGHPYSTVIQSAVQVSKPFSEATPQNVVGVNWEFGIIPADDMPSGCATKVTQENNIA